MFDVDDELADELGEFMGRGRVQTREQGLEEEFADYFGVAAENASPLTQPKPFAKMTKDGLVIVGKDQPDGPSAEASEAELVAALAAAEVKLHGQFVGGYFLPAIATAAKARGHTALADSLTALAKKVGNGVCQVARADGKPWATQASPPAGKCVGAVAARDGYAYGVVQAPANPTLPVTDSMSNATEWFELENDEGLVVRVKAQVITHKDSK